MLQTCKLTVIANDHFVVVIRLRTLHGTSMVDGGSVRQVIRRVHPVHSHIDVTFIGGADFKYLCNPVTGGAAINVHKIAGIVPYVIYYVAISGEIRNIQRQYTRQRTHEENFYSASFQATPYEAR